MRRGFSLLEVIIYVGLLAGVMAALVALFTAGLQTKALVAAQTRMAETERLVELTIQERLAESSGVTVPASGAAASLTATSSVPNESPAAFSLSGTSLDLQLGIGAAQPLNPTDVRVTSFSVTRLDGAPASVRVVIGYATDVTQHTLTATSTFTATLPYD